MSVTIDQFLGIRNTVPAQSLKPGELAEAVNVVIDDDGQRLRRRPGRTLLQSGARHSLWGSANVSLYRQDDKLYRVNPDLTTSTLVASGLARQETQYLDHPDVVFLCDGVSALQYRDGRLSPWGITPPAQQPLAAEIGGRLPRGRYQYALTFLRADGEESGTGRASLIVAGGGIRFTAIAVSLDPSVYYKAIYLSGPDGKTLKRALLIPNASTEATYTGDTLDYGVSLETQFKQPPPPGQILAEHNGRVLVAVGEHLLYSDPYLPERFDPIRQGYRYESAITIVAPVGDGVYVGTEKRLRFMAGEDIASASEIVKAEYGALYGSLGHCEAQDLTGGQTEEVCAVFSTERGVCEGLPGGQIINLTLKDYKFPAVKRGAGIVIHDPGRKRYVAALRR
ncbi:MAG: hypothetical protein ACREXW_00955 [Gammaproteobacteria bacterium]